MRDVPGRTWYALVSLCTLVGALLVLSAPVWAAAPEEPETGKAEPVTNTTAVLHGTVNPKASAAVASLFQYKEGGECGGAGASTTPAVPAEGVSEVVAQPAEATLAGLKPATQYTFCLVVRNEAEEVTVGKSMSFVTTASGPIVTNQLSMSVNATEATLGAQVDAGGISTTYSVEYGPNEPYASSGQASLPAGEGAVGVLTHIVGLTPNTQYHFRFVASSALGSTRGADVTFKTIAAGSPLGLTLPDGRSYELVSPAAGNQEVYVPNGALENKLGIGGDVRTERPFRSSEDGSVVAFVDESFGGELGGGTGNQGQGAGDEWVGRRTNEGWGAIDIQPPLTRPETAFQAFSSDLSRGYIKTDARDRLSADVPEKCRDIYAWTEASGLSAYQALFTSPEKARSCGGEGEPVFAGASLDNSRSFFQTVAALTPGSVEAPGGGSENLYESINGQAELVNVLSNGVPDPNATYGGPSSSSPETFSFSHAISADGSRAFWTDVSVGIIYLHEDGRRTIQVSAGESVAQYWTATQDGRFAFYTEGGKLFRFNVRRFVESSEPEPEALNASREELVGKGLAHEPADVQGVLGASDDGAYVYFVAGGVLAANENQLGDKATLETCRDASEGPGERNPEENVGNLAGGGCNLYRFHVGVPLRFIATLAPKDNNVPRPSSGTRRLGDWRPDLASKTAEVTRDGGHLLLESRQRLTGYDNGGAASSEREVEIFVYNDDGSGHMSCASCNPSGTPPVPLPPGGEGVGEPARAGAGTHVTPSAANTYMPRWINDSGTRAFFDTSQALLPQDTNETQDVYEWEQGGTGTCNRASGCVYLLSGGNSTDNSFFVDASTSGGDAFFATREELVPNTGNQKMELYDAHECTASAPCPQETSLACTGSGCQGVPPAPPIFATPSSVTFNGVGNFALPSSSAPKLKTASQIGAKKLAKALKVCRSKKSEHKRAVCQARARRQYGLTHKASKFRVTKAINKRRTR
jgi:hypothetical protein